MDTLSGEVLEHTRLPMATTTNVQTLRLSARLAAIASLIEAGDRVADIGTDHALLSAYLVLSGRTPKVIASDVRSGPLAAATHTLARWGVAHVVELRMGHGLEVLTPGEVDTIVVAGMGGLRIVGLLQQRPDIVAKSRRIVLQPNTDALVVRTFVGSRGLAIVDDRLVHDRGKDYSIIAVEHEPLP